jgi:hypothetical protein
VDILHPEENVAKERDETALILTGMGQNMQVTVVSQAHRIARLAIASRVAQRPEACVKTTLIPETLSCLKLLFACGDPVCDSKQGHPD